MTILRRTPGASASEHPGYYFPIQKHSLIPIGGGRLLFLTATDDATTTTLYFCDKSRSYHVASGAQEDLT